MDTIAKIIYDRLASGGGIYLPEIGWLQVEREPARFISARELQPPHNRVVYSRHANPALESAVDILSRVGGMEKEEAERMYAEWSERACGERGYVEINGVGVIKNDHFYPSVELYESLNPSGSRNVPLKRRGNGKTVLWIAALALAAVIAVLAMTLSGKGEKREKVARTENVAAMPSDGTESVREAAAAERAAQRGEKPARETSGGGKAAQEKPQTEKPAQEKPQAQKTAVEKPTDGKPSGGQASAAGTKPAEQASGSERQPARAVQPTRPTAQQATTYHVVVGIFDTQRNADKCIGEDPVKIGKANYKIYPYSKNRLMVSAFESADKAAAEAKRRELRKHKPDAWVYARKH